MRILGRGMERVAGRAGLGLVGVALAGCQPSVNVNVGFDGGRLRETTVWESKHAPKVALIDVRGLIADMERPGLLAPGANPVDRLAAELKLAEKDDNVRAVILRINSPGGTVSASDTMYQEVRRFRETSGKPVVASMGEVAASGGYYLALSADKVYAQPTTITGSIGVIMPTMNFSDGLGKLGIQSRSIKSGPNKDLANPFEPIRDSQYAVLQGMVDEFYARFRGLVVERRPALKPELVNDVTDGRVVTGARAAELGLVDGVGGVREAFGEAKSLAGVPEARLVKYGVEGKPVQSAYAEAPAGAEINVVQLRVGELSPLLGGTGGVYYLWSPGW